MINTSNSAALSNLMRPATFKIIGINLFIWLSICTIGATGNYQDRSLSDSSRDFFLLWFTWINGHTSLFFVTSGLYIFLKRNPTHIATAGSIIRLFLLSAISLFPLHVFYSTVVPTWLNTAGPHSMESLLSEFIHNRNSTWFFEFTWFTGSFTVVVAILNWHIGQARNAELQQTQSAFLQLDLALEQQRLRSLKQQLEPHFIFNALNAISALVRTNEQSVALAGIHRLSELLRYALMASSRDWVSFHDEIEFIRDYLALQQLRYGARLEINITIDEPTILNGDCLPLLLQPLIENALRHDLDCHEEHSKITLHLSLARNLVTVKIHNRRHVDAAKNPGLGLGLSQTQLRLEMMYRGLAKLQIIESTDDFSVVITMPLHRPESAS
jgi:two-component system sensor histidine kinase AlgZ